eukprot:s50_g53.t1
MILHDWEEDVRLLWEDLVVVALPIGITIVRPQPPFFTFRGAIVTVIVEQNMQPNRVACLTTAVFPADPTTWTLEAAHSTMLLVNPTELLRIAGVETPCRLRHEQGHGDCSLHVGFHPLPMDQNLPVTEGMGIVIRVPPLLSAVELEQHLVARVHEQRWRRP